MQLKKFLILGLILCAAPVFATTRYIAQSAGTFTGGVACNGHTAITPATWNSTAESPGDTSYVCGTITGAAGANSLTFGWSGSSGNPITLIFDANAVMTAPYWGGNNYSGGSAAIFCSGYNYIVINGGTNGIVQNSANGTGLTYQQASTGVAVSFCGNVTVENLTIQNIYIHTNGDTSGTGNTVGLAVGAASNVIVSNNHINNAYATLNVGYTTGTISNITIGPGNVIDHGCHIIDSGDGSGSSVLDGYFIYGNVIGPHNVEWNGSDGSCHEDTVKVSAFNTSSTIDDLEIYNNTITSDMCSISPNPGGNCTALIFLTGNFTHPWIYNNVIAGTEQQGYEGLISIDSLNSYSGSKVTNLQVYNNVFDEANTNSSSASCTCSGIKAQGTTNATWTVENNVFLNWAANGNAVYLNTNSSGVTFDSLYGTAINNNDYFPISGIKIGHDDTNGQDYSLDGTYLAWQSSHATNSFPGYDGSGSGVNPSLTSPSYIPGAGSVVNTLGANLTSIGKTALNSDSVSSPRPSTGAWTAGWRNYGASPPSTYNPGVTISGLLPPTNLTATLVQ